MSQGDDAGGRGLALDEADMASLISAQVVPLPDAAEARAYEALHEGATARLLTMREAAQRNQHALIQLAIESQRQAQQARDSLQAEQDRKQHDLERRRITERHQRRELALEALKAHTLRYRRAQAVLIVTCGLTTLVVTLILGNLATHGTGMATLLVLGVIASVTLQSLIFATRQMMGPPPAATLDELALLTSALADGPDALEDDSDDPLLLT